MMRFCALLIAGCLLMSCQGAGPFVPEPDGNDSFDEAVNTSDRTAMTAQTITLNDDDYFYAEALVADHSYMLSVLVIDPGSSDLVVYEGCEISVYDSNRNLIDGDISLNDYPSHFMFNCKEEGAYYFRLRCDSATTVARPYILSIENDDNGDFDTADDFYDYCEGGGLVIDVLDYMDVDYFSMYLEDDATGSDFQIVFGLSNPDVFNSVDYQYKLDLYDDSEQHLGTSSPDSLEPGLQVLDFTAPALDETYYVRLSVKRADGVEGDTFSLSGP